MVGAGLAGLAAARRLESGGLRVTVVERAPQVGGRLASSSRCIADPAPELMGLARELGVESALTRLRVDRLTTVREAGESTRPLAQHASWLPWRTVQQRRLRRLLAWFAPELDPADPEAGLRFDDRSVGDFARVYLGRERLPGLYAPLLSVAFGLPADDTSRLLLLRTLDAWGDPGVAVLLELPALAEALAKTLRDLRLGQPVAALGSDGRSVRLESGEVLTAELVVLATSAAAAAELTPRPAPRTQTFFEAAGTRSRCVIEGTLDRELPTPLVWLPESARLTGAFGVGRRVTLVASPELAARARSTPEPELRDALVRAWPLRLGRFEPQGRPRHESTPTFRPGQLRRAARLREEQRRRASSRPVLYLGSAAAGPDPESAVLTVHHALDGLLRPDGSASSA